MQNREEMFLSTVHNLNFKKCEQVVKQGIYSFDNVSFGIEDKMCNFEECWT